MLQFIVGIISLLVSSNALAETIFFSILHTNDLHSSVEGAGPDTLYTSKQDGDPVLGGYARLAHSIGTIKKERRARGRGVLTVDAGDFFSGTLFHTLGPRKDITAEPEFEFFHYAGYDATTFGNHEFDAGELGLLNILAKGRALGSRVNILTTGLKQSHESAEQAVSLIQREDPTLGTTPKAIVALPGKRHNLRIGLLGLTSPGAAIVSVGTRQTMKFVGFDDSKSKERWGDIFDLLTAEAKVLREQDKADVVVLLMHGDKKSSLKIAENIPQIDVIIGGHSHEIYCQKLGRVILAQAGDFGRHLGVLDLKFNTKTRQLDFAENESLRSIEINDSIPSDPVFEKRVQEFKSAIDTGKDNNFFYGTTVAKVASDLLWKPESQDPLGRFLATKVLSSISRRVQPQNKIDAYVTVHGMIRSEFHAVNNSITPIQFSDVFKFFSLGFDSNFRPGSPLVDFWMHKSKFKKLLEFTEFYGRYNANAIPVTSDNITYSIRSWGIPLLNRIANLTINGVPFSDAPELLHIATNRYTADNFKQVENLTFGLVKMPMLDGNGYPIEKLIDSNLPREYLLLAEALAQETRPVGSQN